MQMNVRFRGGGEYWYEIEARGEVWHVSGAMAFADVMHMLYRDT